MIKIKPLDIGELELVTKFCSSKSSSLKLWMFWSMYFFRVLQK